MKLRRIHVDFFSRKNDLSSNNEMRFSEFELIRNSSKRKKSRSKDHDSDTSREYQSSQIRYTVSFARLFDDLSLILLNLNSLCCSSSLEQRNRASLKARSCLQKVSSSILDLSNSYIHRIVNHQSKDVVATTTKTIIFEAICNDASFTISKQNTRLLWERRCLIYKQ